MRPQSAYSYYHMIITKGGGGGGRREEGRQLRSQTGTTEKIGTQRQKEELAGRHRSRENVEEGQHPVVALRAGQEARQEVRQVGCGHREKGDL